MAACLRTVSMNIRPFSRFAGEADLTEDRVKRTRALRNKHNSWVGVAAFHGSRNDVQSGTEKERNRPRQREKRERERKTENGLDNNARTGYRETVAAKPRSGPRRCLN